MARPVTAVLVGAELVISFSLLDTVTAPAGGWGAFVVLAGLSGVVAVNLVRGRRPPCHCFGRFSTDQDGTRRSLDSVLDPVRPLLLVFTQPTCGACHLMLPQVADWKAEGLIQVAVVSGGPREDVIAGEIVGRSAVLRDVEHQVFAAYGITSTPAAVLIDGRRRLLAAPAFGGTDIEGLVTRPAVAAGQPRWSRRRFMLRVGPLAGLPFASVVLAACGSGRPSDKGSGATTAKQQVEVDGTAPTS